jgi:hypothetical protein
LLSFAIVYFFESGLFNGLRPIQIKKFSPYCNSRLGLWAKRLKVDFPVLFLSPRGELQECEGQTSRVKRYSTLSVFRKAFALASCASRFLLTFTQGPI